MVGYSATPQARKLGLKPGMRVSLSHAPPGWSLEDPPVHDLVADGPADIVIAFVRSPDDFDAAGWGERIFPDGAVWVAWPRRAAGHVSAVTENGIRDAVLPLGLVDVKVAALDHDWSSLKIVWRTERRLRSEE